MTGGNTDKGGDGGKQGGWFHGDLIAGVSNIRLNQELSFPQPFHRMA